MDKLKPCPFCGHEAMISYNTDYDFQAYCTNDSCFMSQIIMEDMETEEQARAAWNKRTPSVPAVPLDKLCEYLNSVIYPCIICKESPGPQCNAKRQGCWERVLKKWMEESNRDAE